LGLKFTLYGKCVTKKNSNRILYKKAKNGAKVPFIAPSAQYKRYETDCLNQIFVAGYHRLRIDQPVNVCCVYYMPDRRLVDLANLINATCDILVRGCVLLDDNSKIVASHDGSRVRLDPNNPRVEIEITGA